MRKTFVVLALLALVVGMTVARQWVPLETGQSEQAAEFRVVSSNSFRTVVELELAGVYVGETEADGRTWQTVELGIEAGGLLTEQGAPQLPIVARAKKSSSQVKPSYWGCVMPACFSMRSRSSAGSPGEWTPKLASHLRPRALDSGRASPGRAPPLSVVTA